jgi:tRNA (guanine-N7-)-methyltransferase
LQERRSIRSYVLRQGRISNAQRRAHAELFPVFGVPFSPAALDLAGVFGRAAPKVLEIGFGMGETTAEIAQRLPERDYLGVEVHTPGVGSLLARIAELHLANVRIVQHDVVEVLQRMIGPGTLDGVHIFFPDPWPKKRHHKRRLIQAPFVALLASKMKRGAVLHTCTDWEDYARQMLEVFSAEVALVNTALDYADRPDARPQTKFERRGLSLGHRVWDLVFRKV